MAAGRDGTGSTGNQGGTQREGRRQREPSGDGCNGAGAEGQLAGEGCAGGCREGVAVAILMAAAHEGMQVEMFEVGGGGNDRDAVAGKYVYFFS